MISLLAMAYLVAQPIYLQFLANQTFAGYQAYSIADFRGQTVEESFGALSGRPGVFYVSRPTTTSTNTFNSLNQTRHFFDPEHQGFHSSFGDVLMLEDAGVDLDTFSQSGGLVFSSSPDVLDTAGVDAAVTENLYRNPLLRFVESNLPVIAIVAAFALLLSVAAASAQSRENALRALHGQAEYRVTARHMIIYLRDGIAIACVLLVANLLVQVFIQRYSLTGSYFWFYGVLSFGIVLFGAVLYALALSLVQVKDIAGTLKKNEPSKHVYRVFIAALALLLAVFPFLMWNTFSLHAIVTHSAHETEKIKTLGQYYTYFGMNSQAYDSLNDHGLVQLEERFRALYGDLDAEGRVFYFDPLYLNYENSAAGSEYATPGASVVLMNRQYYQRLAQFDRAMPDVSNDDAILTVLVPRQREDEVQQVMDFIRVNSRNVNTLEIPDGVTLEYADYNGYAGESLREMGSFTKTASDKFYVIGSPDQMPQMNPIYNSNVTDAFTTGMVFTDVNFGEITALTHSYDLSSLVTPTSKLSPYQNDLESLRYYYTITLYAFIFSVVAFVIMTVVSTRIILLMKKKEIAVYSLHGKSIARLFTLPVAVFCLATAAGVIAVIMRGGSADLAFLCATPVLGIMFYMYVAAHDFATRHLTSILKGE
ncbi:MAG: hypothetical protein SPI14_01690 [Arcanobacterium sp.]|nr:hypothetical protein [Arcanobacterium sp.]